MPVDQVKRIYSNINILLQSGVFAGQQAEAIFEAQQFVTRIIHDLEAREEAGPSVGDAPNTAGVAGDQVPPAKRKGRKGRSKPA